MVRTVGPFAGSRAARAATGSVGVVGAAVAAGLVAERRAIRRRRNRPDAPPQPGLGPIGGRVATVIAADGVPLYVEETGPKDAPLTLVFVHGFCVSAECWVLQHRALSDLGRMVFFDQRAHGRSGPSEVGNCTIDVLADDLYRVIRERAPGGPIILIGHSMGGMAVLGLADAHPELFDDQIIGVALLSTSASELAQVTLGLPALATAVVRRVLPGIAVGMRRTSGLLERVRGRGSDMSWEVTRRIGFGATDLPPSVVTFLETMVSDTSVAVIAAFLPTLLDNDRLAAAARLVGIPTVLVVGDADLITPVTHSRTIAEILPEAELVVEEDAGHAIMLERPEVVNAAIRRLVQRSLAEVPLPLPRSRAGLPPASVGAAADGAPPAERAAVADRDAGGTAA
ncbi:alpha/beta fold hydrolase [Frankia sp. QA3]|uniref:alpha/beta fold hydrolase n=1 Tax=Frankia sp. QA3 TaxID=710111 RepID=UPI000269C786|nr:alpha/beta hydrolase [Frankia sp. QA3]EIV94093.1 putative hydrolase or acyltransferase of alpha/beta superfamily [Frankia sp. QA3]